MRAGRGGSARTSSPVNPFMSYNFCVEVQGLLVGGFTSVEGLESKNEVLTIRQGGVNDVEYKLPGQVTYTDLVLKAGITSHDSMWLWYQSAMNGAVKRQNGSIYLLDDQGNITSTWNFYNAWPVAWVGPSLDASQNLVATQSFTLAHEGIWKRANGGAF
ncbi:phage tail protein [Trinickia fusca]|uniref:Phage tail protein n=1 Tax=Trinickia fusca TaxID=2419777 RepID=A0A494XFG4_9BURK|nr:phage tail protein [Trinickia fusca]RKP46834.1 phage tail protein [Trinickia fusca]